MFSIYKLPLGKRRGLTAKRQGGQWKAEPTNSDFVPSLLSDNETKKKLSATVQFFNPSLILTQGASLLLLLCLQ